MPWVCFTLGRVPDRNMGRAVSDGRLRVFWIGFVPIELTVDSGEAAG